ncbi:hypothetical protein Btru_072665 [Bulinus truncatus]|nr:hypothetical protein Btru_072665 [Bulinus truncatus]
MGPKQQDGSRYEEDFAKDKEEISKYKIKKPVWSPEKIVQRAIVGIGYEYSSSSLDFVLYCLYGSKDNKWAEGSYNSDISTHPDHIRFVAHIIAIIIVAIFLAFNFVLWIYEQLPFSYKMYWSFESLVYECLVYGGLVYECLVYGGLVSECLVYGGLVYECLVYGGLVSGGLVYEGLVSGGLVYEGLVSGGLVSGGLVYGGLVSGVYGGLVYGGLVSGGLFYGGLVFECLVYGGLVYECLVYGGLVYGSLVYGGLVYRGLVYGGKYKSAPEKENHSSKINTVLLGDCLDRQKLRIDDMKM